MVTCELGEAMDRAHSEPTESCAWQKPSFQDSSPCMVPTSVRGEGVRAASWGVCANGDAEPQARASLTPRGLALQCDMTGLAASKHAQELGV